MIDDRTKEERLDFDPAKHRLGKLCLRQHDAGNGQSWRHIGGRGCVTCTRERAASWNRENTDRHQRSTRRRDLGRSRVGMRRLFPFSVYLAGVRRRAKGAGILCTISTDAVKVMWRAQEGRCYWTGRSLDFNVGGYRHPFRPSLDRLDPSAGYVDGNVVWSSNFANRGRGELGAAEFASLMTDMGFSGMFSTRF